MSDIQGRDAYIDHQADDVTIRLSKRHKDHPWGMDVNGERYEVNYWPGDSKSGMFGGAEVNADRLCAYARSSGYGIEAVVMAIRSRKAGTKAKAKAEAGRDKETAGKRELTH